MTSTKPKPEALPHVEITAHCRKCNEWWCTLKETEFIQSCETCKEPKPSNQNPYTCFDNYVHATDFIEYKSAIAQRLRPWASYFDELCHTSIGDEIRELIEELEKVK